MGSTRGSCDPCKTMPRVKRRAWTPAGGVKKTFNLWAKDGRADLLENEHSYAVLKRLESVRIPPRFLDVGCGSGWLVRRIAASADSQKTVGIDISSGMIRSAKKKATSAKEMYVATSIESWRYRGKFDLVFSMEVIYYADSVDKALAAIYRLMAPGATMICGTDFYAENKATRWWAGRMGMTMHLLSRAEWRSAFKRAGFATTTRTVKNPAGSAKWKREVGTLFITGIKPRRAPAPKRKKRSKSRA